MYCVYKHTSPIGKVYIGITGMKPEKRWNYGNGYPQNTHLSKAIRRYGWENFKHEILLDGLTKEEACKKEMELIAQYNSTDERFGYNHSLGGDCAAFGSRHSEETKKKMSEMRSGANCYWYGKKRSAADRKKMSEAKKGKPMHENTRKALYYAITHPSEETRRKLSQSSKGRPSSRRKSVICVETGAIYNSVSEASEKTGIVRSTIQRVCLKKPRYHTAGGYHWAFYKKD